MPQPDSLDQDLLSLRIDKERKVGFAPRARTPWRTGLSIGLLMLLAVAGWLGWWRWTAVLPRLVTVMQVQPAAPGDTERTVLTAGGYIIPRRKIQLSAKVAGRVAAVTVEKGDQVQQGQVLVQLEEIEFRAQVSEARGNLHMAQARLQELLTGSRPQEVEQAQASVAMARANWRNAKVINERAAQLFTKGLISQEDYDQAQMTYDVSLAQVTEARKRYELIQLGPRQEKIAFARGQVEVAQAAVTRAETFLDATTIKAPIDGTVLEKFVEVGETVTTVFVGERGAKSLVVSLADLQDVQVELDISQADFHKLSMRQQTRIVPEAYADRIYDGNIEAIAPEANRQKATIQVKVKVRNPDPYLRPEMNVKVSFLQPALPPQGATARTGAVTPRITIPLTAIKHDGATAQVFLVRNAKAVVQEVTLGRESPQGVEILEGLDGGEHIIRRDVEDIQPGMAVRMQ